MSKRRKEKLDLSPKNEGLHNPFAAFDTSTLPPGDPFPEESKATEPPAPAKLGRVVLRKETAHRGGKAVIVIHDFAGHLSDDFIDALARKLRKTLGCGGSSGGRAIEIQGDQPAKIRALLEAEGFKVAGVR